MKPAALNNSYVVFLVACLVMIGFYHGVISDLNGIIFSGSGDGIKNYYTYMFHAKYDGGFWDFTGMNYPFYENIVYTDAHPLLSYLIGQLGLADYGIGILNVVMLLSFPISAFFIHKVLKHYGISGLWAFLSALVICFMAPQVFRLTGHLSLSYAFAIPLMWYLLIKVESSGKWMWSILMFLTLFICFFTHPYLGLILAIFGLTYALIFWFFNRKQWLFYGLKIVAPVLVSIVLFQVLVNLSDTHVDRMETPAGFFHYYGKWSAFLVPHHGPMNYIKHKVGFKMAGWESWAYIGLATITYIVIGVVYYIRNRKEIALSEIIKSPLGKIYIAGHLILLFSFCFPLKYDFLRWVTEVLGPLKQFRVLARFGWVYFYIVMVCGVWIIAKIKSKSTSKLTWDIVFYVGILFTILEFYPTHIGVSKSIGRTKNPFQKEHLSKDLNEVIDWTKGKQYDAILFLPFTHFSSENIYIHDGKDEQSRADAMMLSYHTHLPLLNTVTSRTSVSESALFINFFSYDFIEKPLADSIGSDKKIMLIKNNDGLNINELKMVWESEVIFKNGTFTIFEFSQENWNSPQAFNKLVKQSENAHYDVGQGFYSDTNAVWFLYDSFDELKEPNSMTGPGALSAKKSGYQMIKTGITDLETGPYICSFWYNYKIDRADQLAIIEQKFESGNAQWMAQKPVHESTLIVDDWAYVELEFEVTDTVAETKVLLSWKDSKQWLIVDELLIRKANDHPLFKKETIREEPYLIYNNYWVKANSFSK